jgi:hypothetical protein
MLTFPGGGGATNRLTLVRTSSGLDEEVREHNGPCGGLLAKEQDLRQS